MLKTIYSVIHSSSLLENSFQSWIYLAATFLIVTLFESLILWKFKLSSLSQSISGSLVMNLASTLVGMALLLLGPLMYGLILLAPLGIFGTLLATVMLWTLAIAVEAGVLLSLQWQPRRQVWRAVAIANAVTYGIPLVYWLIQNLARSYR